MQSTRVARWQSPFIELQYFAAGELLLFCLKNPWETPVVNTNKNITVDSRKDKVYCIACKYKEMPL